MVRLGRRLLTTLVAALLAIPIAYAIADGRKDRSPSMPASAKPSSQSLERFAMQQTRRQAVRTCRVIPRRILSRSFSVKGPNTNNYISLGYARDIDISPIPLQRAAYNGCDKGLRLALR
jgi:hypothetical protein